MAARSPDPAKRVRRAPILQRLRHRPVARFDRVQDLDRSGNASAEFHANTTLNKNQSHMRMSTAMPAV